MFWRVTAEGFPYNTRLACLQITLFFLYVEVYKHKYHISVTTVKNLPFKSYDIFTSCRDCTMKACRVSTTTNKKNNALEHEQR